MSEAMKKSSSQAEPPAPPIMVGQASAQCHIVFARPANPAEAVGRTPWSARDALVPHPEQRFPHLASCEQADGGGGRGPGGPPDALVPHPEQRFQHLASCEQADGGVGRGPGGPPHHLAGAFLSILKP